MLRADQHAVVIKYTFRVRFPTKRSVRNENDDDFRMVGRRYTVRLYLVQNVVRRNRNGFLTYNTYTIHNMIIYHTRTHNIHECVCMCTVYNIMLLNYVVYTRDKVVSHFTVKTIEEINTSITPVVDVAVGGGECVPEMIDSIGHETVPVGA